MSQPIPIDLDPIKNLHDLRIQGYRNADVQAITAVMAEDVIVMPNADMTLYGKAELKDWLNEYFADFKIDGLEDSERVVTRAGDYLIERSTFSVLIIPIKGGKSIRDEGRMVNIWRLSSQGWQIWQSIWNSMRPIGAGTSRFMVRYMQRKPD